MRRLEVLVVLIAAFVLVSPAWSQCQYAHVVDPCEKRVIILATDNFEDAYQVHLDEGPAAAYEPRGVALASAPDAAMFRAFVTQGPYLRIVDYSLSNTDGTITDIRTVDLVEDLSLPPVELTGIYAADPIVFNDETYYFLYIVGTEPGPPRKPWLVIFEQEGLLSETAPFQGLVYAGQIGADDGRGIDIAAGASLYGGAEQVAYASVLSDVDYEVIQRFYKITWNSSQGFDISLAPWNSEAIPFAGSEPESLGLDHESLGIEAYGVFQTSSVVSTLSSGDASCDLVGDPTDVGIWGPDAWGGYVQFVTVSNEGGNGKLLGYDGSVCPYSGYDPLEPAPGALEATLAARPLSLALTSDTAGTLWAYTANASGYVAAVQVSIVEDQTGDTVEFLAQEGVFTEGCPADIVFRDAAYGECVRGKMGGPGPPPEEPEDECPTTKYCKLFPNDPLCRVDLCANDKQT